MNRLSKRIFYSLLIVLVWFGFVVDGAHALFQSSAHLGDSAITSGTADLLISNSQTPTPGNFLATMPGFNDTFIPGEEHDHYFFLKNNATGSVNYDLFLSAVGNPNSQAWMSEVHVNVYPVDGNGVVASQGYEGTVATLQTSKPLDVVVPAGSTQRFLLKVSLDQAWQDQNSTFSYGLTFSGVQQTP